MIDLDKIKREPTARRVLIELLLNVWGLLPIFYGLNCLVTLHGTMLLSVRGQVYSTVHLVPVTGTVAAMLGLACVAFGLFIYFSDGNPPAEDCPWLRGVVRALIRWGSLAVAAVCYLHADKMVTGRSLDLAGLPVAFLVRIVAFIVGFIFVLSFLGAMFQREQVKRELFGQNCEPLHIRWRPAAYWMAPYWFMYWGATGFRVVYSDPAGSIHKTYCFVYRSFLKDWRWGNRRVRWLTDTITGQAPGPEVWVDSEILRPRLGDVKSSTGPAEGKQNESAG